MAARVSTPPPVNKFDADAEALTPIKGGKRRLASVTANNAMLPSEKMLQGVVMVVDAEGRLRPVNDGVLPAKRPRGPTVGLGQTGEWSVWHDTFSRPLCPCPRLAHRHTKLPGNGHTMRPQVYTCCGGRVPVSKAMRRYEELHREVADAARASFLSLDDPLSVPLDAAYLEGFSEATADAGTRPPPRQFRLAELNIARPHIAEFRDGLADFVDGISNACTDGAWRGPSPTWEGIALCGTAAEALCQSPSRPSPLRPSSRPASPPNDVDPYAFLWRAACSRDYISSSPQSPEM